VINMQVEAGAVVKEAGNSSRNKTGSWRTFRPRHNGKCSGCGICAWYCPEGLIRVTEKEGKKTVEIDLDYCKGCGICSRECTQKAIMMERERA
jgi:2-oxoacid:acceptor oxidoreductase delta subunit (pyruvate/2-ketoisovalerate family)